MPIEEELKGSYLTYAMSVIVSRALPDVRDGLKPSQRRILVAMNDLNLTPGAGRVKCAKISGDTSGNYHPHGESVIYPTLVRMAQEWNMRHVLVDKQGNFGSIAGLPRGGHAIHRSPHVGHRRADAGGHQARHGRFRAHLRRAADRADRAALEVPQSAGQRGQRHRGGHGHVDPAAQPGRNLRRPDPRDRRAGRLDRRIAGNRARPRFSHRRRGLRPRGHPPRIPHRPEHDRRPRPGDHRGTQQPPPDRHHAKSPSSRPATASKSGSPRW